MVFAKKKRWKYLTFHEIYLWMGTKDRKNRKDKRPVWNVKRRVAMTTT
jgi:hypothetical protein